MLFNSGDGFGGGFGGGLFSGDGFGLLFGSWLFVNQPGFSYFRKKGLEAEAFTGSFNLMLFSEGQDSFVTLTTGYQALTGFNFAGFDLLFHLLSGFGLFGETANALGNPTGDRSVLGEPGNLDGLFSFADNFDALGAADSVLLLLVEVLSDEPAFYVNVFYDVYLSFSLSVFLL